MHKQLQFHDRSEGQGQGHKFQTCPKLLDDSINSLSVKVKFQMGQCKSLNKSIASLKANLGLKVKVTSF